MSTEEITGNPSTIETTEIKPPEIKSTERKQIQSTEDYAYYTRDDYFEYLVQTMIFCNARISTLKEKFVRMKESGSSSHTSEDFQNIRKNIAEFTKRKEELIEEMEYLDSSC